jgi:hypothetical protein
MEVENAHLKVTQEQQRAKIEGLEHINIQLNAEVLSASVLNKHRIEEYEAEQRQAHILKRVCSLLYLLCNTHIC